MRRHPIVQGEHAVFGEPAVAITTVLGSCISVCLIDPAARVGGMNHFLLGEPTRRAAMRPDELQRYGIHAMEVLINAMMAHGADRTRLRAHLYGGADIVPALGRIGTQNAQFARRFLDTEGIAVTHEDAGGSAARKVEFLPYEGKARCSRVARTSDEALATFGKPPLQANNGELELFR